MACSLKKEKKLNFSLSEKLYSERIFTDFFSSFFEEVYLLVIKFSTHALYIYRFRKSNMHSVTFIYSITFLNEIYKILLFDHKHEDVPYRVFDSKRKHDRCIVSLVFAKTISKGIRDWKREKWNSS